MFRSRFLLLLIALVGALLPASLHVAAQQHQPTTTLFPSNYGPIEDAQCNIEDLEQANDSQLYTILKELKQTSFFRQFLVDLESNCPLSSWSSSSSSAAHGHDSASSAASAQEDEFECSGGSAADDLDEDAEPLCTVDTGGDADAGFGDPFGGAASSPSMDSNFLQSLSQQGYESKAQEDTFEWEKQTDMVVQMDEEEQPCGDSPEEYLPETFWMDVCSNIQAGDGTKLVNLVLNPERNTGYNGTHIWQAIYEENCIVGDGSEDSMCLEERVLYRLLSGLHTSTTLSIAMNYYPPSKKKGRTTWEPNPDYFMEKFHSHPEYLRNLHFSYVVLLRAMRKATPFLYDYEIRSGNMVEDEAAQILLRRLLDSAILQSCSSVFSAFDESVMFQETASGDDVVSLQQNFKGVFHNISSILDCVQCQQCKLHGKMTMLGYGTALKILFLPEEYLTLEHNEIVAFINTIAKFSESMREVKDLSRIYWEKNQDSQDHQSFFMSSSPSTLPSFDGNVDEEFQSLDLLDNAVGLIAELGRKDMISFERERTLIDLALSRHPELLVLAKHYRTDLERFHLLSQSLVGSGSSRLPDAVVIGSGLAGLSASLNILDRGGSVVIIEKEHLLGGNSNKASSGINAYREDNEYGDALELFRNDTIRSAGEVADLELIDTLVTKSGEAVAWLKERVGVDLTLMAQLGGHSSKRTHRPSNGMAGAEIIYHMQKAVKSFEKIGKVQILVDTKATQLLRKDGQVVGVQCENADGVHDILADNVILATGGFAADRSSGSYLEKYRPELLKMPATAGAFSTGDGITLATELGASTRDMDKVQVHPTGWVDPSDPDNKSKTLAAELMRGVGGILINSEGKRFCNELGTRAYVTDKMLSHNPTYAKTGIWDSEAAIPSFSLVLSASAAEDGKKHVDLYSHKGLMTKVEGVDALAQWIGVPKKTLVSTLREYQSSAKNGRDEFGKESFRGVPDSNLSLETFYVGKVTPGKYH